MRETGGFIVPGGRLRPFVNQSVAIETYRRLGGRNDGLPAGDY